jgi:hypothetical protein
MEQDVIAGLAGIWTLPADGVGGDSISPPPPPTTVFKVPSVNHDIANFPPSSIHVVQQHCRQKLTSSGGVYSTTVHILQKCSKNHNARVVCCVLQTVNP